MRLVQLVSERKGKNQPTKQELNHQIQATEKDLAVVKPPKFGQ